MRIVLTSLMVLFASACVSQINSNELGFGERLYVEPSDGDFAAAVARSGRFCYKLAGNDDRLVTAAHIHRAGVEAIAVELVTPQKGRRAHACTTVGRKLATELRSAPQAFLLDLHVEGRAEPAVRAQLRRDPRR